MSTNPWLQFLGGLSDDNRLALLAFLEATGQPNAADWSAETAQARLQEIKGHLEPAADQALRQSLQKAADFLANMISPPPAPFAARIHEPVFKLPSAVDVVLSLGIPVTILPSEEKNDFQLRFRDQQGRLFLVKIIQIREDDGSPMELWALFHQEQPSGEELSPMSRQEFEKTILPPLHKTLPAFAGVQLILSRDGMSPSSLVSWSREDEAFRLVSEIKPEADLVVPPDQLTTVMHQLGFQKEERAGQRSSGDPDSFTNRGGNRVFAHISHGMLRIIPAAASADPDWQLLVESFKEHPDSVEKKVEAWRGIERINVRRTGQLPIYELLIKSLIQGSGIVLELTPQITPTPNDLAGELGWERVFKSPAGSNSHDIFLDPTSGKRFEIFTEQQTSERFQITIQQLVSDILHEEERLSLLYFENTILRELLRYPWNQVVLSFLEPMVASDSYDWIREENEFKARSRFNDGSRRKRSFLIMTEALACFGLKPVEMPYVILTPLFHDEQGRRFRVEMEGGEIILKILSNTESIFPIFQSLITHEEQSASQGKFPPPEIQGIRVERMEEQSYGPIFYLSRMKEGETDRFREPQMTPDQVAEFLGWRKLPGQEKDLYQDRDGRQFVIEKRGPVGLEITQIVKNKQDPLRFTRAKAEQNILACLSPRFVHLQALLLNFSEQDNGDPFGVIHWLKNDEGKFEKVSARSHRASLVAKALGFRPEVIEEGEPLFYSGPQGRQFAIVAEGTILRVVQFTGDDLKPEKCTTAFDRSWMSGKIDRVSLKRIQRVVYSRRSPDEGRTFILEKRVGQNGIRFELVVLNPETIAALIGGKSVRPEEVGLDPEITKIVGPLYRTSNCIFTVSIREIDGKKDIQFTQIVSKLFRPASSWIENFVRVVMPRISAKLAEAHYVVYHSLEPKTGLKDVAIFGRKKGQFTLVYMDEKGTEMERNIDRLIPMMQIFGMTWGETFAPSGHPLFSDNQGRVAEVLVVNNELWLILHKGPPLNAEEMMRSFKTQWGNAGKSFTDAFPYIKVITPRDESKGLIDFMLQRRSIPRWLSAEMELGTLHDYEREVQLPQASRSVLPIDGSDPDDDPPPKPTGRRERSVAPEQVVNLDERTERTATPGGKKSGPDNLHHLPLVARSHPALGRSILTRSVARTILLAG